MKETWFRVLDDFKNYNQNENVQTPDVVGEGDSVKPYDNSIQPDVLVGGSRNVKSINQVNGNDDNEDDDQSEFVIIQ